MRRAGRRHRLPDGFVDQASLNSSTVVLRRAPT